MQDRDRAYSVRIRGRVQGVGFRAWTRSEAEAVGLKGWVRNAPDGSVVAAVMGSGDAVATFMEKLHEGPPGARVTAVETLEEEAADIPAGRFEIRR